MRRSICSFSIGVNRCAEGPLCADCVEKSGLLISLLPRAALESEQRANGLNRTLKRSALNQSYASFGKADFFNTVRPFKLLQSG